MASLIQKMISQQSSFRATPDEPQALPLADVTIWQLDKATWAKPRTGQSLSVTPDKPQVVETRPLLAGPSISRIEWLTVDHRPHLSTAWEFTATEYIWLSIRHANFASWSLIRRLTCRFSFNHLYWSLKQIILNVIFILNHDYTWHYEPEHSVLVRTCSI